MYDGEGGNAGKFYLYFGYDDENGGEIQYSVRNCIVKLTPNPFEPELPKDQDPERIWRFSVSQTEDDVRFIIYDNENEALNILMSETCDDGGWETVWKRTITQIEFPGSFSAAEVYRLRSKESGN